MCFPASVIWVIFDHLNEPHAFGSKKEAKQAIEEWPDWDITEPIRFEVVFE